MSEEKTYVFGNDGNYASILAPLLSLRGIDPSVVALMNNRNGFGGEGSWFIWVIFLFFLMGWGGNGWGNGNGNGLASQLNNDAGREMLLQAINGNGQAIGNLATTLNCDINAVQTAINAVQSQIQSVGNQVGLTGQQTINAIQAGNMQLASQIAQCCCDNKLLVTEQGYQNRIAISELTNLLGSKIDFQTGVITDKFCQLEKREMQSKIDHLLEKNSQLQNMIDNANQTAQIQAYIAQTVNPVAADVAALKAAAPPTVAVPYPQLSAVPTSYLYGYGPYYNNGSLWA